MVVFAVVFYTAQTTQLDSWVYPCTLPNGFTGEKEINEDFKRES